MHSVSPRRLAVKTAPEGRAALRHKTHLRGFHQIALWPTSPAR